MFFDAHNKNRCIILFRTLFFASTIFYFSYHLISGDNGASTMLHLMKKVSSARIKADEIRIDRLKLEHRVNMLYSDSIDIDLLDEQARKTLGYTGEEEVIYFLSPEDL